MTTKRAIKHLKLFFKPLMIFTTQGSSRSMKLTTEIMVGAKPLKAFISVKRQITPIMQETSVKTFHLVIRDPIIPRL